MNFPRKSIDYAGRKWFVLNHSRCCKFNKWFDLLFGQRIDINGEHEYICYVSDMYGKLCEVRIGSSFIEISDHYYSLVFENA